MPDAPDGRQTRPHSGGGGLGEAMRGNGLEPVSATERRSAILQMVHEGQLVRVAGLSQRFSVSQVVIRRDLIKLGDFGLLRRVHGGAVGLPVGAPMPLYSDKLGLRLAEKRRIGQAAAELIHPADRIIFDSGTTVLEVARCLAKASGAKEQVTAITASFPVFQELAAARNTHLIVLGGIYLPDFQGLVGPQTLASLRDLHVDKLFSGADGLSVDCGVTTANVLEAEVSRAMVHAAKEVIVVADSSKIGKVGLTAFMSLKQMSKLITDTEAPADFVAALRAQGIEVILV
jgi:DeoR/GlpR family transcriptional regulator of sugar metabolism